MGTEEAVNCCWVRMEEVVEIGQCFEAPNCKVGSTVRRTTGAEAMAIVQAEVEIPTAADTPLAVTLVIAAAVCPAGA